MNYGRLQPKSQSEPEPELTHDQDSSNLPNKTKKSKSKLRLVLFTGITLIVAAAVAVVVAVSLRSKSSGGRSGFRPKPTKAISRVCSRTLYQNLCVNSLVDFPGSLSASDKELVHISINMTLQRVGRALYTSTDIINLEMDTKARSAYNDCVELLEDSIEQLQSSLISVAPAGSISESDTNPDPQRVGSSEDVLTWLSASLTNQDTCTDGLSEAEDSQVKKQMTDKLKDLSELVSNSLAIYSATSDDQDFGGVPIQNRRRLMSTEGHFPDKSVSGFPKWIRRKERKLMQMPVAGIQADVVVSKNGNGTCKTIKEAIKMAPQKSNRRFIIYVRAGR